MNHLKATFPVSERRAARLVSVSRSTLRYQPRVPDDEPQLLARMEVLVRKHPRYGYRRSGALLRREGFRANPKRVYRLWKKHEYTRECPTLLCNRIITAQDVIDELIRLMKMHGVPAHVRADNGPEFIGEAIRAWLSKAGVGTLYVEPGAPWENGYAESFQARLRDEFLNAEVFANLREAKALGEQWRREYNDERPHSSLGSLTPSEFAAGLAAPPVGATPLPPGQPLPS